MPAYIYCGTYPPVGADGTQGLLVGQFNAIWYPPPKLNPPPVVGERVWLVWRADNHAVPVLLGSGRIATTDAGNVLWTNATLPGVEATARALGYRGPQGMDFMKLNNVGSTVQLPLATIGGINTGMHVAKPQQVEVLSLLLPIPAQVMI